MYNPGVNLEKNIFSKIKKFTTDFRSENQRMHNKTFTVEGKVVITGGRNIANETLIMTMSITSETEIFYY